MTNIYVFLKLLPYYLWILAIKDLSAIAGAEDPSQHALNTNTTLDILPQVRAFES